MLFMYCLLFVYCWVLCAGVVWLIVLLFSARYRSGACCWFAVALCSLCYACIGYVVGCVVSVD